MSSHHSLTSVPPTNVLLLVHTWVEGPSGGVNEVSGIPVISCTHSVGGDATCAIVQKDESFTATYTYSGPTEPQVTLEVNDESGDIRILGLSEEENGEGEGDGDKAGGDENDGGDGGQDEQGSAPAVGASIGLAFAATLTSGLGLLFL